MDGRARADHDVAVVGPRARHHRDIPRNHALHTRAQTSALLKGLEHDPEKLADFSDKIMRQDKEKESAIGSISLDRALVFEPAGAAMLANQHHAKAREQAQSE